MNTLRREGVTVRIQSAKTFIPSSSPASWEMRIRPFFAPVAITSRTCSTVSHSRTSFDVLKRAHAQGLNLVVTHEPTFWTDSSP
jgi:hypothetical protein